MSAQTVLFLCQALNKTRKSHPDLEIKLSLWKDCGGNHDELCKIMSSFRQIKRLASVDLTFENVNLLEVQELITRFKNNKSLSKLSITLDQFQIIRLAPFTNLIESIAEINSLKNSRIWLKRGSYNNGNISVLQGLMPSLKKVVQKQNLEIVFENTFSTAITQFKWNSFVSSIQNLHPENKIRAKFIGKKAVSNVMIFVILLIIVLIVTAIAVITSLTKKKSFSHSTY